ncbi:metal-dependent hydrolase [Candidatus Synchoanobacter obligatus]|uniref:Metal-dependent hydrolase n=1 Tax=Candidatus Synchoanobacter obligatus TaxID=2919597 RepID=A0ABT1L639_9GAMM|nr:metal-dependent hydrolase [Candidatus Synchoanobacter obligatus]MCP8352649.1 metal-dependent hydrolase [Candidatus Synchoanobacter obligatus]
MAGFKGHVTFGIMTAVGYAGSVFILNITTIEVAQLSFFVTIFSSMLPDIDSNSGTPVQIVFGVLSLLTMLITFDMLRHGHHISALNGCLSLLSGLGVYTIVQGLFKKMTHHRGAFHSIPMALIFSLSTLTILNHYPINPIARLVLCGAVLVGYLCHLTLDELNSLKTASTLALKPKKSFGTALKLTTPSSKATAIMYTSLCYLLYINQGLIL